MISAKNLRLVYPDGQKEKVVLNDVSFDISDGEHIVLLGPSGSGKSSLIYLLSLMKNPTSGKVFINGKEYLTLKEMSEIRYESFGFIFQQHFLIQYLTVLENVTIAKKHPDQESKKKALDILERLGLKEHINKKPFQLSGGERQRVAIARAVVKEPAIIFADEPTASLDHDTGVAVIDILKNYNKSTTLIMATHDTSLLNGNERIMRVFNGNIS